MNYRRKTAIFIITIVLLVVNIKIVNSTILNIYEDEKIILIDPGHGGIDGGAKSKNGTIEKEINLQIACKLRDYLVDEGYIVYMTRENDASIGENKKADLRKRVLMKKETNCDIYISIHQNMFSQASCYGAQVWYASNEKSKMLGNYVQNSLKETISDKNKRVSKPAGQAYLILRDNYEGASIIVECGFLSNYEEELRLKTEEHQDKIVEGISKGIDKYFEGNGEKKGVLE